MDNNEILEKVQSVVKETINRDIKDDLLKEDVDLITAIGMNSIDAISILVRIEEVFDLEINDEDLSAELIQTTGKLTEYIASRLG